MAHESPTPEGRWKRVLVAALALAFGAFLAFWALDADERAQERSIPVTEVPSEFTNGARGDVRSTGPGADPIAREPSHADLLLTVRVVEESTEAAIRDARVALWPEAVGEDRPGSRFFEESAALAQGATDADGQVVLRVPATRADSTWTVGARASGFQPTVVSLSPSRERISSVELILGTGSALAGRVVDPQGAAVQGVRLIAAPTGLDPHHFGAASIASDGRHVLEAESDEQGCFEFVSLATDGSYRVVPTTSGWHAVEGPLLVSTTSSPDEEEPRLVICPVRAIRLKLRDQSTDDPVSSSHATIAITDPSVWNGGQVHPGHLFSGRAWRRTLDADAPPGEFVAQVLFRSESEVPKRVRFTVLNIFGYRAVASEATIFDPDDLATDRGDLIRIPPERVRPCGRLLVREDRPVQQRNERPWRLLRYQLEGTWNFRRGEPAGRGHWRFCNIPVGSRAFAVSDSFVWSAPSTTIVKEGQTSDVTVRYPGLSALQLTVQDTERRPVFGSHIIIESADENEDGQRPYAYNGLDRTAPERSGDGSTYPLPAGRHEIFVSALGFQSVSQEIEARSSEIRRLTVTLRPD